MCDLRINTLKDAIAAKDLSILPANGIYNIDTIEEAQSLLESLRTQKFAQTNPWADQLTKINHYQRKARECDAVGDKIGSNFYHNMVRHFILNFYF
jgi:hypothetical protein